MKGARSDRSSFFPLFVCFAIAWFSSFTCGMAAAGSIEEKHPCSLNADLLAVDRPKPPATAAAMVLSVGPAKPGREIPDPLPLKTDDPSGPPKRGT